MRRPLPISILAVFVLSALAPQAAGPPGGGCGKGACCRRGGGTSMAEARDTFHALLSDHEKISRVVEDVEGGVSTVTTSSDPEVAAKIRLHVRQMHDRLREGAGLRYWDPLFAAIFEHHDKIDMAIEDVEGGVKVVETSKDPKVVPLIRQHARRAVSEFVARGFDRAHEPTPLPEEGDTAN